MKNLITICGRGGSKGLKNKNIKEINGYPLIYYSIHAAMKFKQYFQADIALSTDAEEIRKIAGNYGLSESYLRPPELSTDQAGKLEVIEHLVKNKEAQNGTKYEFILDLDITSPLRTMKDLSDAFQQFASTDWALNMFSVSEANRNPYFNMVEDKGNGRCKLVKGNRTFLTRQSAPRVFDINASFYFYRRAFFDQEEKKTISDRSMYYEIKHTCFDIDHEIDFKILSYLLEHDQLDFEI